MSTPSDEYGAHVSDEDNALDNEAEREIDIELVSDAELDEKVEQARGLDHDHDGQQSVEQSKTEQESDRRQERAAIEAVLMVASDPVPAQLLAELLEVSVDEVSQLCNEMAASYDTEERGFVLGRVAGGYRFQSHPAYRAYVERFILDDVPHRLSPAALETLAIVAYKQPISRVQIATIRGVNVDGVMRALTQRGYVEQIGRDDGPGQAVLFGTTPEFLERLGLDSIAELPPLAAFVPDVETVEALEHVLRAEPEV